MTGGATILRGRRSRPARPARPAPTVLDRAIGLLAPGLAEERAKARQRLAMATLASTGERGDMRGGYRGGRLDRAATKGWRPWPGSADEDTIPDLEALRTRSRDAVRNVMVAAGAVSTMTTNVVGPGLALKPRPDREALELDEEAAAEWARTVAREWALWCASADWYGRGAFDDLQALAFRSVLESGDVLVVRRFEERPGDVYGLRLALVEADHVSNPDHRADTDRLRAGVQLSAAGVPEGYYVADVHPGDRLATRAARWSFVPRVGPDGLPLALHLYQALRPNQARGVPYLAPVVEALKQLSDYTDAEVSAAVNSAMIFAAVTTNMPEDAAAIVSNPDGGAADPIDTSDYVLESGSVVGLRPGEKLDMTTPGRPNSEFEPFTLAFLRFVGVSLDLPFELLVKHFTASYSASRAALEMGWQAFRVRRAWLARALCAPVYRWFLTEAVARGRVEAPGFLDDPARRAAWLGADWIGPARVQLDPLKEANADRIDVAEGFKTVDQVLAERTGGTFQRKHEARAAEHRARVEAGLVEGIDGAGDLDALAGDGET